MEYMYFMYMYIQVLKYMEGNLPHGKYIVITLFQKKFIFLLTVIFLTAVWLNSINMFISFIFVYIIFISITLRSINLTKYDVVHHVI